MSNARRGRVRPAGLASRGVASQRPTVAQSSAEQEGPSLVDDVQLAAESSKSAATSAVPSGTKAKSAASKMKFRPKVVRRSSSERRRIEERERAEMDEYTAQERREQGLDRPRGRGRGRGGPRGRGGFVSSEVRSARSTYATIQYPTFDDHEEEAPVDRLNADRLYDVDEENVKSEVKNKLGSGLMPVGLVREPHKPSELVFATATDAKVKTEQSATREATEELAKTASSKRAPLWGDDKAPTNEEERITAEEYAQAQEMAKNDTNYWGTGPKGEIPMVRGEDGVMRPMNIGESVMAQERAEQLKTKQDEGDGTIPRVGESTQSSEEQNKLRDLRTAVSELGISVDGKPVDKAGRVFLFQLPEVLPVLAPIGDAEGGQPDAAERLLKYEDFSFEGSPLAKETGFVGKLKVRKSGKAELDWGGLVMNVSSVPVPEFVQKCVVVEYDTDNVKNHGQIRGRAYDMGRVTGKYSAVPKHPWDDEFDDDY